MNILVIGASGMIGSHVRTALQTAGHRVIGASRRRPEGAGEWFELDFTVMQRAENWLPCLQGIDAVVNCVGILREAQPGDFDLLHRDVPIALFEACAKLGIRRVVQVSALGSGINAATPYWRSKGAAEADLLARDFGTVIRPSLVYGLNGASSRVFRLLATLPFIMMPLASGAKVQPIHVDDLTEAVLRLLAMDKPPREIAVVGPRAMSMTEYLTTLRQAMQAPCGIVLDMPMPLAHLAARIGQLIPSSALTPDALTMLEVSRDGSNTADASDISALLGRAPRDPAGFAGPELRSAAVTAWAAPAIRIAFALLWLLTAWTSWFGWPHAESHAWLAACGVPEDWRETTLLGASLLDAGIGLALLLTRTQWIWPLQIAVVGTYTLIMSVCLPQFWLHPFGVLGKNIPLLVMIFGMWRLEPQPARK